LGAIVVGPAGAAAPVTVVEHAEVSAAVAITAVARTERMCELMM